MSASNDTVLSVEHLTMRFGGLVAIGDVSFDVKRGEITALIGPNGAGKTTVFNCITGFYKPTEGMITMRPKDGSTHLLERLPGHEVNRKAKVARTFQNIRLFSGMTVLENLLVAQHNKLMRASGFTILGLLGSPSYKAAKEESMELAKYWLEHAKLIDRADEAAGSLPYGDQRRLEIARAMCTAPELLCLDEPAAGLNPSESLDLNKLLRHIKSTGTSVVLIEHDMSVVMEISDHVIVLEYGRKISDGDPAFVRADPKVIAAYLGVDDEEVEDVLVEVGDDHLIGTMDDEGGLDLSSPAPSASMLAGPIDETIDRAGDDEAESLRVDPGASRAELEERILARLAREGGPLDPQKAEPAAPKTAPVKSALVKSAPAKPAPAKSAPAAPLASIPSAAPSKARTTPAKTASKSVSGQAEIGNRLKKPRGGKPDDLLLIKGIGPINQRKLNEHGIYHFDQIAAWKRADIVAAEAYLEFDGRILREDWMGQAMLLAAKAQEAAAAQAAARPAAKPATPAKPAAKAAASSTKPVAAVKPATKSAAPAKPAAKSAAPAKTAVKSDAPKAAVKPATKATPTKAGPAKSAPAKPASKPAAKPAAAKPAAAKKAPAKAAAPKTTKPRGGSK